MVMIKKNEKGQVALILVLAATVAGTLVISLADRSTRNLRTQTLDTEKIKALKGAESGVERALLSQGSVVETSLGEDGVSFSADYVSGGSDSFVSELVQPGETLDVLVEGADKTLSKVRILFSSETDSAALKVSEYRADETVGQYEVNSYAVDGDGDRVLVNNFDNSLSGSSIDGVDFGDRVDVGVKTNTSVPPTTRLIRIMVLYSPTKIGVEVVGGSLPGQQVVISSVGSYSVSVESSVKKRLELRKEMEKVPVVFENVLYSNSKLIQ